MASHGRHNWVSQKIRKILHEGVRRSTRKPVSSSNPRRNVSQDQAVAIALSMARKRGMNVRYKPRGRGKKA